ncbi:Tripartite-type tricarboxylate transporter, receptor component TctC [Sphaerochaeta associata]|uniref:Tripartite tricarboxylate transporter substrate binding protein n=1 Tax=Sphaerochaeta associata TaxID=1129264 RepID=A0ABY4DCT0_9SPIR|nr:tripartite tricarboxylate transporter substrate binding protein [Sphaerochaeta associata]UOM51637.1 tripartite tricarboxylate transporter substrate binding protein [Sphaerochaeta associata]SMP52552.1 Tripartite-type tricarboxylate transporter, receptor component TctC [Sphaerochaeta associata]
MKKALMVVLSILMACSLLFAAGSSEAAVAADLKWPERPIQVYVGANAGGGIDTAARLMGKYLEKELGATIVVSNMSGGAGSIAATKVKESKPDGYTMLVCHEALLTNKISGITDFDYGAFTSGGIALKVFTTCLLSRDYKSFDELLAAAKSNPGKIKFGTEAATNDTHIIAMMQKEFGTKIQIVDSGAISNQIASMMGGHIDFMKSPVGLVKDYVRTGEFNLLGFFNDNRNSDYPDIPTLKEKGLPFVVDKFFYAGFPKGTPNEIIEKFSSALERVSQNPEFIADAKKIDYAVEYVSPAEIPAYFEAAKKNLVEYQKIYDEVMGN